MGTYVKKEATETNRSSLWMENFEVVIMLKGLKLWTFMNKILMFTNWKNIFTSIGPVKIKFSPENATWAKRYGP